MILVRILMYGWEFPPYKTGGLGTACKDLTKGLARQGVRITFVMPVAPPSASDAYVKLIGANNVTVRPIDSLLLPYSTIATYETIHNSSVKGSYGHTLFAEVHRYAHAAGRIAQEEDHDIIHVHDWMTYKAGIAAKKISGKPLVAHIHATEYDRTLGHPHPSNPRNRT